MKLSIYATRFAKLGCNLLKWDDGREDCPRESGSWAQKNAMRSSTKKSVLLVKTVKQFPSTPSCQQPLLMKLAFPLEPRRYASAVSSFRRDVAPKNISQMLHFASQLWRITLSPLVCVPGLILGFNFIYSLIKFWEWISEILGTSLRVITIHSHKGLNGFRLMPSWRSQH
jgi:hypothetical protein